MRKIVIALIIIIIVAAFFSGCRSSAEDITGLWYEKTGLAGTMEFKDDGVVTLVMSEQTYNGTYTYDIDKGDGTITVSILGEEKTTGFTLSGGQLNIEDQNYTREKVEQQDIGDIINDLESAPGN